MTNYCRRQISTGGWSRHNWLRLKKQSATAPKLIRIGVLKPGISARCPSWMAANEKPILHFVNPIATFRDLGIVRYQQQRLPFFLHNSLEQLESTPGIRAIQVTSRFIGQN